MVATLVDSNVVIDLLTRDSEWDRWSAEALARATDSGPVAINPVIYAEVSVGYPTIEGCEAALLGIGLCREMIPWTAAFLAGKAFTDYRRRGGARRSPLPDFFIGAHAAVAGMRLLTRDPDRYRTYFPTLQLVSPA